MSNIKITTGRTGLVLRSTADEKGEELERLSRRYMSGVVLEFIPEERLIRSYVKVVRYDEEQFYAEYRFEQGVDDPLLAYQNAVSREVSDAGWRIGTGTSGSQEVFDALDSARPDLFGIDVDEAVAQLRDEHCVDFTVPDGRSAVSLLRALHNHSDIGNGFSYVVCNGGLPDWYENPDVIIIIDGMHSAVAHGKRFKRRVEDREVSNKRAEVDEALEALRGEGDDERIVSQRINAAGLGDRLGRRATVAERDTFRSSFRSAAFATCLLLVVAAVPTVLYFARDSIRSLMLTTVRFGGTFSFGTVVSRLLTRVGLNGEYPLWQVFGTEAAVLSVFAGAVLLRRLNRKRWKIRWHPLIDTVTRFRSSDTQRSHNAKRVVTAITNFTDQVRDTEYAYADIDEGELTAELSELVSPAGLDIVDTKTYRLNRLLGVLSGVVVPLLLGMGLLYLISELLGTVLMTVAGSPYAIPIVVYVFGGLAVGGIGATVILGLAAVAWKIKRLLETINSELNRTLGFTASIKNETGQDTEEGPGASGQTDDLADSQSTPVGTDDISGVRENGPSGSSPTTVIPGDITQPDDSNASDDVDDVNAPNGVGTTGDSDVSDTTDKATVWLGGTESESSPRSTVNGSASSNEERYLGRTESSQDEQFHLQMAHRQVRVNASNDGYLPFTHLGEKARIVERSSLNSSESQLISDGKGVYFSTETELIGLLLPELSDKWRAKLDTAIQRPLSVSSDTAYLPAAKGTLRAHDLATGQPTWMTQPLSQEGEFISPLIVTENRLYAASSDGVVYAIGSDGESEWKYKLSPPHVDEPPIPEEGSIAVDDCITILIRNETDETGLIEQVDNNGEKVSSYSFDGVPVGPPVMNDRAVYVTTKDQGVIRVDDGNRTWRNKRLGQLRQPPAVDKSSVYAASQNQINVLEKKSGESKWTCTLSSPPSCPPVVTDDRVYLATEGGLLVAIDKANQSKLWSKQVGTISGEPVITADHVVIRSEQGLFVFRG